MTKFKGNHITKIILAVIALVGAIVGARYSYLAIVASNQPPSPTPPPQISTSTLIPTSIPSLTVGTDTPQPPITIQIVSPRDRTAFKLYKEGNDTLFPVKGMVSGLSADQLDHLYIYTLVRLVDVFAQDWWIQAPVNTQLSGEFESRVYTGDTSYPRKVGDQLEIVAILTDQKLPTAPQNVHDPNTLTYLAKSNAIQVTVSEIVNR